MSYSNLGALIPTVATQTQPHWKNGRDRDTAWLSPVDQLKWCQGTCCGMHTPTYIRLQLHDLYNEEGSSDLSNVKIHSSQPLTN